MKGYLLILMIMAILFAVGCSTSAQFPTATRTVRPTLPAYPNAQQEATRVEQGVTGFDVHITTFQTPDLPVTVVQFYLDRLPNEGWEIVSQDRPGFLILRNTEACPFYGLYVTTTVTSSQITDVELRLTESPCLSM